VVAANKLLLTNSLKACGVLLITSSVTISRDQLKLLGTSVFDNSGDNSGVCDYLPFETENTNCKTSLACVMLIVSCRSYLPVALSGSLSGAFNLVDIRFNANLLPRRTTGEGNKGMLWLDVRKLDRY
jgi:hypothetical protein